MSELASGSSAQRARVRVEITGEGPVLVHGPIDVVTPEGATVRSERAVTALCTCRRRVLNIDICQGIVHGFTHGHLILHWWGARRVKF